MTSKLVILPAVLLPLSVPALADDAGEWRFSAGIDYSSGNYGESEDTDILFVPTSVAYKRELWSAKLTVPWVQIKGPGSVVGAGDGSVVIGESTERIDASGLGDIWAEVSRSVDVIPPEWFYLDLVGKLKFPTADESKGLGTGEFDYTAQLDLFKPMGRFTPMATLAYKFKGDPDGVDLDNVLYASLGGDYRINDMVNVGATVDFQEATTSSADNALEIFSYVGVKVSDCSLLTLYGYAGLSDGSPDAGGGLQWRWSL